MANLFIQVLCVFWFACIQPAPHAANQTCSCCLCPQTNCCTRVCSLGLVKSHQQVLSVGLLCTTSLQWHIYTWLSLPLLHTLCVWFERPVLAGRVFWSICSFTVSALLHLLHGTVCLSSKHWQRLHWHSSKAHGWHQLTVAGENLLNTGTSEVSKPTSSDCPWLNLVSLFLLNPFVVAVH